MLVIKAEFLVGFDNQKGSDLKFLQGRGISLLDAGKSAVSLVPFDDKETLGIPPGQNSLVMIEKSHFF